MNFLSFVRRYESSNLHKKYFFCKQMLENISIERLQNVTEIILTNQLGSYALRENTTIVYRNRFIA